MNIKSNIKNYSVEMKDGFYGIEALLEPENTYFVMDKNVYDLYGENIFSNIPQTQLKIIEAKEQNKTIETALDICESMISIPAKRNARLVSFGGGVIQDITGFAANILYRGVHWTFVPTTLLAASDSCIGGKTSLNFKSYKNLLGTFYPPEKIVIYPAFFKTLTDSDFNSGLGEVLKFNLMNGETGLSSIENDIHALLQRDETALKQYIESSLLFKKPYIEEDEFDMGIRIHLNFAHTFGHAFETTSNYVIPHGTAVAMGMVMANRISLHRGLLEADFVMRAEKMLLRIIDSNYGKILLNAETIIDAIRKDKKQTNSDIKVILMNRENKLLIINDITPDEIVDALKTLQFSLSK